MSNCMKDRFVKNLVIAMPLAICGRAMTMTRTYTGAGYTLEDADQDCMKNLADNWMDLGDMVGTDMPVSGDFLLADVATVVQRIVRDWPGVTACTYGFALKGE